MNTDPGVGSIAINVAAAELSGIKVPRKMIGPTLWLTIDDIKAKWADIGDNESAYNNYTYGWMLEHIIKAKQ